MKRPIYCDWSDDLSSVYKKPDPLFGSESEDSDSARHHKRIIANLKPKDSDSERPRKRKLIANLKPKTHPRKPEGQA
jgi:hypothetical protein